MKPSTWRSAATVAFALAILATSCSAFRAQSDLSIKPVEVNLVFGAKVPATPAPAPPPPVLQPPTNPVDIPFPTEPEVPTPKPKPFVLCPPLHSVAAATAAVANITKDNQPVIAPYFFQYGGNWENESQFTYFAFDTIENMKNEGEGFAYTVVDGATRMAIRLLVQPQTDSSTQTAPGLYLEEIDWPLRDKQSRLTGKTYAFVPAQAMELIAFPIQNSGSQETFGTDTAGKQEVGVTNPNDQTPVLKPSANTLHSQMVVGSRENIQVCADIAQAWRVGWTFESVGEFNFKFVGTFWLGTAYGGWPLRSSFTATADPSLMAGNFDKTLLRLDAGALI